MTDPANHVWSLWERAQAAPAERARAQIKAMSKATETEFTPLPVQPRHQLGAFSLDAPRRPRHQSARSASIDMLLDHLGVRPRGAK